jgi:hypothetical protein
MDRTNLDTVAPVKTQKLRGRPKRMSTTPVSSQCQSQSQLDSSQLSQSSPLAQSLSSVDLDSLMQDPDVVPSTDALLSSEKEPTEDGGAMHETAVEKGIKAEANILDVALVEESFDSGFPSADAPATQEVEVVEETMIEGGSSSHGAPSAVFGQQEELDIGLPAPGPTTDRLEETISEGMTEHAPRKVDSIAQTEFVEEPTETPVQNLRNKIRSLITDLGAAALSREEVNALDDMFMDAKEQLFGAARRGRSKGL